MKRLFSLFLVLSVLAMVLFQTGCATGNREFIFIPGTGWHAREGNLIYKFNPKKPLSQGQKIAAGLAH